MGKTGAGKSSLCNALLNILSAQSAIRRLQYVNLCILP
ncbi:hypothetical protein ACLBOM_10970 [Escherichia coli]